MLFVTKVRVFVAVFILAMAPDYLNSQVAQSEEIGSEVSPQETFFKYCGKTVWVPDNVVSRLENDGWVRLPLSEANKFFFGVLPAERFAYQNPDLSQPFVITVAVGGVTEPEAYRMYRSGLEVETRKIDPSRVIDTPMSRQGNPIVGNKSCGLNGFSLRAGRMPWLFDEFLGNRPGRKLETFNRLVHDLAGERFNLSNYLIMTDNEWGFLNVGFSSTFSENWDSFFFYIHRSNAVYQNDDPMSFKLGD